MNAPLRPAWLVRRGDPPQPSVEPLKPTPQAAPAGERHLWNSRFGLIEVEVRGGQIYVNGEWVQPAEPES